MIFIFVVLFFAQSKVYFQENFRMLFFSLTRTEENWEARWKYANVETADDFYGKFDHTAGDWYGDEVLDKGLKTSVDARHYVLSAYTDEELDCGKSTVLQFSVKHTQQVDCGGSYLKYGPKETLTDLTKLKDDTEYSVMFGPDVCGAEKKVHLIFSYNGENLLWKKKPTPKTDKLTHVYTAIFNDDNTYSVLVDGTELESGDLEEDWDFLLPKIIPDPADIKPDDWVDEAKIADPEDVKPEDWDDEPKFIADPEAAMPEDWDEEEDGEWEAPQVPNPEYKGEWRAKMIDNPEYKGEWVQKEIDNPDYVSDENLFKRKIGWVGIEVWQVKTGTIFDNILITDSVEEADAEREKIMERAKKEKETFDEIEKVRKAKEEEERKKAEEERKIREEEEEAERILKEAEEAAAQDEEEEITGGEL